MRNEIVAAVVNRVPKYVASTTLDKVDWNKSMLLEGDVPDAVAELKKELSGEIHVSGSWGLLQTLIREDLVDEYDLWTFPVLLGTGKRLFDTGTIPAGLELMQKQGILDRRGDQSLPSGEIKYGSFALEE